MVEKHGADEAKAMLKKRARLGGKSGGGHNRLTTYQLSTWKVAIESVSLNKRGWISELGRKMNCSHTQVKRILNKYFPDVLLR